MEVGHIKYSNCGTEIDVGGALANNIAGDVETSVKDEAAKERYNISQTNLH